MSIAITYATKHGATLEIARRLADALGGAASYDLADGAPDLSGVSLLVLGTPIYAGKPLGAMAKYAPTVPPDQQVGLFAVGMIADPAKRAGELADAYPAELRDRAVAAAFLDGRYQFGAMNRMERFIIKRVAKTGEDVDAIDDAAIAEFAGRLLAHC